MRDYQLPGGPTPKPSRPLSPTALQATSCANDKASAREGRLNAPQGPGVGQASPDKSVTFRCLPCCSRKACWWWIWLLRRGSSPGLTCIKVAGSVIDHARFVSNGAHDVEERILLPASGLHGVWRLRPFTRGRLLQVPQLESPGSSRQIAQVGTKPGRPGLLSKARSGLARSVPRMVDTPPDAQFLPRPVASRALDECRRP